MCAKPLSKALRLAKPGGSFQPTKPRLTLISYGQPMQVHWTTDALEMLAAICGDLERTSPTYAETVANAVIKRGNLLADLPY